MPEIISRKEARALGLKRYFTGDPCKYGHTAQRRVSSSDCIGCDVVRRASDAGKRAKAKWSQKTRKTTRRRNVWASKREAEFARHLQERISGCYRSTKWRKNNPERARATRLAWELKNREKRNAASREWQRKNGKNYRLNGPSNPKDERQWLRKSRAILRNLKRALRNPHREASTSSQMET